MKDQDQDVTNYYEDIAATRSPLEMNEFDLCVIWHAYVVYPAEEKLTC